MLFYQIVFLNENLDGKGSKTHINLILRLKEV